MPLLTITVLNEPLMAPPEPAVFPVKTLEATFNVPNGRYKLRGWHPRGGERSVVVVAN